MKDTDQMEINGIARTFLTVSDFPACREFYLQLLTFVEMTPVLDADGSLYCVGGRTALGIMRADDAHRDERFVQSRVGLHHLCFRARERGDVDTLFNFLQEIGAKIVHPPQDGPGHRATTPCFSKTPTASGSNSTTCRARGCWGRRATTPPPSSPLKRGSPFNYDRVGGRRKREMVFPGSWSFRSCIRTRLAAIAFAKLSLGLDHAAA